VVGDCLRAGKTITPASPSPAQSATKGMSYHAMNLAVYAESSSATCVGVIPAHAGNWIIGALCTIL